MRRLRVESRVLVGLVSAYTRTYPTFLGRDFAAGSSSSSVPMFRMISVMSNGFLQSASPPGASGAVGSAQLLSLPAPTSIAGVLPAGEVAEGPAQTIVPQRGTQAVVPAGPEEGAIFRDTVPAEEGGPELIDL